MGRSERRIFGFVVAILILAFAVGLLGWGNRRDEAARRQLQQRVDAATGRVGVLEGQLRDHGIEPTPDTTTTTVRRSGPRTTSTTRRTVPVTVPAASTTTTTTARPSPTTTTTSAPAPSSTTSTTQCTVRLGGQCAL